MLFEPTFAGFDSGVSAADRPNAQRDFVQKGGHTIFGTGVDLIGPFDVNPVGHVVTISIAPTCLSYRRDGAPWYVTAATAFTLKKVVVTVDDAVRRLPPCAQERFRERDVAIEFEEHKCLRFIASIINTTRSLQ